MQMKDVEEYFPVVLFIMMCKVDSTFGVCEGSPKVSVKCDHLNESC